jgi:hypothetical protein
MGLNTAGSPDGTTRGEADDQKWPWPARLLVTVLLLPVGAAAILAAENSLNFIGSWFSPVIIVLMIAIIIAVWVTTARSQR